MGRIFNSKFGLYVYNFLYRNSLSRSEFPGGAWPVDLCKLDWSGIGGQCHIIYYKFNSYLVNKYTGYSHFHAQKPPNLPYLP